MSNESVVWADRTTKSGLPADEVISALQKEIRRGNSENAVRLAHEMVSTGTDLEDMLWQRLMVISVEDIGLGEPNAPVLINSLVQMLHTFDRQARDRELFAVHAVRYLCLCTKDRSSDEITVWLKMTDRRGQATPTIPEYARDMHTSAGKRMGRDLRHFLEEGARVRPELQGRDTTYRNRVMEMLDADQ